MGLQRRPNPPAAVAANTTAAPTADSSEQPRFASTGSRHLFECGNQAADHLQADNSALLGMVTACVLGPLVVYWLYGDIIFHKVLDMTIR